MRAAGPAARRDRRARRPAGARGRGQRTLPRRCAGSSRCSPACWPSQLVLLLALRLSAAPRADRALVPLMPIALATGWSALVLFALASR